MLKKKFWMILQLKLKLITKTNKSKFCINYANVADDGKTPDILSFDESILSFKIGGTYPVLTATNAYGDSETFEYIDMLILQDTLTAITIYF